MFVLLNKFVFTHKINKFHFMKIKLMDMAIVENSESNTNHISQREGKLFHFSFGKIGF